MELAKNTLELDENEVKLVERLRRIPTPKRAPVVRLIDQLLELASPSQQSLSDQDYLNDPLWKLIGAASSGIKNDDGALRHDDYIYGAEGNGENLR